MADSSVTQNAEVYRVESTVSKVMTVFAIEEKTSSRKQNSGRKRKLSDGDCRILTQIVRKNHVNKFPKITAELNDHLENPVCSKTVKRELNKAGFHSRGGIRKPN